jgi:hypothetical protein
MRIKTRKILFLATVITMLALSASMAITAAVGTANNCTLVVRNDVTNVQSATYLPTDYIELVWSADGTVDIEVRNRDTNALVFSSYGDVASGAASIGQLSPGKYKVTVNGALAETINVDTFFVVPESILGSVMALSAGIAAFGAFAVVKRKTLI